jgi:hypothetical protein
MPRASRLVVAAVALGLVGCATAYRPAPAWVLERARNTRFFSAALRVSLRGEELRGRTQALIAFRRPEALRLEVPGPAGLRLVAVTQAGQLVAVFPEDRAFYEGPAGPAELHALLGVSLAPEELMDLLVGVGSPRLLSYRVSWGPAFPRKIDARLPDGARLEVRVEDPRAEVDLPAAAFEPPGHSGFRRVDADHARELWGRR